MNAAFSPAVVGIDVSKATLAVCHQVEAQLRHLEVANTQAGFAHLVQVYGANSLFVLEATGTYYLALAYYLHARGAHVAVLNPLVIKRFIQMHLSKGKSDRKDAQWLLRYGQQQVTPRWQPDEPLLVECRQFEQVSEQLLKQKTMVSNSLEALTQQPVISPIALQQLQQTKHLLEDQIKTIETELFALLEKRYTQEMTLYDALALHSWHRTQNSGDAAALRRRFYFLYQPPTTDCQSRPLAPRTYLRHEYPRQGAHYQNGWRPDSQQTLCL